MSPTPLGERAPFRARWLFQSRKHLLDIRLRGLPAKILAKVFLRWDFEDICFKKIRDLVKTSFLLVNLGFWASPKKMTWMDPKIKIFRNWSPNKKLQDEIFLMVQIRRITYARYASKNQPALKFRSCRRPEKKVGPKSKIAILDICKLQVFA